MRYRETQKFQKHRDAESAKTENSLDESDVRKLKGNSTQSFMIHPDSLYTQAVVEHLDNQTISYRFVRNVFCLEVDVHR